MHFYLHELVLPQPSCLFSLLILAMRRARRPDPHSFDLTTPCLLCGYRIPPNEILRTGWSLIRCPSCGLDFDSMPEKKPQSAS